MIDEIDIENFDLLNFILSSKMRVSIIYYLHFGDRKLDELSDIISKNPANVSRSLKELIGRGIVEKEGKRYSLSGTGFLIGLVITNLYKSFLAINENEDFWKNHVVKNFAGLIINNISSLEHGKVLSSTNIEFNKSISFYLKNIKNAYDFKVVLPIYSPLYLNTFFEILDKNNTTMELILDKRVLTLICDSHFAVPFNNYVDSGKIKLFVVDFEVDVFLTVYDKFASMFLFLDDGNFDESSIFFVEDEETIKIFKEIFNEFKVIL